MAVVWFHLGCEEDLCLTVVAVSCVSSITAHSVANKQFLGLDVGGGCIVERSDGQLWTVWDPNCCSRRMALEGNI